MIYDDDFDFDGPMEQTTPRVIRCDSIEKRIERCREKMAKVERAKKAAKYLISYLNGGNKYTLAECFTSCTLRLEMEQENLEVLIQAQKAERG